MDREARTQWRPRRSARRRPGATPARMTEEDERGDRGDAGDDEADGRDVRQRVGRSAEPAIGLEAFALDAARLELVGLADREPAAHHADADADAGERDRDLGGERRSREAIGGRSLDG